VFECAAYRFETGPGKTFDEQGTGPRGAGSPGPPAFHVVGRKQAEVAQHTGRVETLRPLRDKPSRE